MAHPAIALFGVVNMDTGEYIAVLNLGPINRVLIMHAFLKIITREPT